jgi:hypothetical protein
MVSLVLATRATDSLRSTVTVVVPLILCSAVLGLAAAAASMQHPLSGRVVVGAALPLSLMLGGCASLAGCGCASLASDGATMLAYVVGSGVSQVVSALLSLAAVAAATTENLGTGDAAGKAQAAHAEETLLGAALCLLLCCATFFALPREAGHQMVMRKATVAGPPRASQPMEAAEGDHQPLPVGQAAMRTSMSWTIPNHTEPQVETASSDDEEAGSYRALLPSVAEQAQPASAGSSGGGPLLRYKLCLFITAAATLAAYPGLTSYLRPAARDELRLPGLPPINGAMLVPSTFAIYAVFELAGRVTASVLPGSPSAGGLLALAGARLALLPALLMTNLVPPSGRWRAPRLLADSDVPPVVLICLLAASNGYVTALALHAGPWAGLPGVEGRRGATTALLFALVAGVMIGSLLGMCIALGLQA